MGNDFFERLCRAANEAGLYLVGYTCGGDDVAAFYEHPEWFAEYGPRFACLNSPFWDREFEIVQEALRLYPCEGLFYDMVKFSGRCRFGFCRAAYRWFYSEDMPPEPTVQQVWRHKNQGEPLPHQEEIALFRFDTWKHWVERAASTARDVVSNIEISLNQQWMRPDGPPYELLKHFDWYYSEFSHAEWMGEVLRAFGDKPLYSGNAAEPRYMAHLLARRVWPLVYDTFTDYRTGHSLSLKDPRVSTVRETFAEIKKRTDYVRDSVAIPHTAVLFSSSNEWPHPAAAGRPFDAYPSLVGSCLRDVARMGLTCSRVVDADAMEENDLAPYEIVFAPELAFIKPATLTQLRRWVEGDGVLVAIGQFALKDAVGSIREEFDDGGLLGVRRLEGPLPIFAVITDYTSGGRKSVLKTLVPLSDPIPCESAGTIPVARGTIGAEENTPIIWRNEVGRGTVFCAAGSLGINGADEEGELRRCLYSPLLPYIRRAPFTTSIQYPAEVWLNAQPCGTASFFT